MNACWVHLITIALTLLSIGTVTIAQKSFHLTGEENTQREATCGKASQAKVLGGAETNAAPWIVLVSGSGKVGRLTGFLISRRHVITDVTSVYQLGIQTQYQNTDDDVDWNRCQNRRIEIEAKHLKSLNVATCGTDVSCQNTKFQVPQRGVFVGHCDGNHETAVFGVVVLEFEHNFDDPAAVPMCLTDKSEILDGTKLSLFGLGEVAKNQSGHLAMRTAEADIRECSKDDQKKKVSGTICIDGIACPGDQGGPFAANIDGRWTAVGMALSGPCKKEDTLLIPILGDKTDEICAATGVCLPSRYEAVHGVSPSLNAAPSAPSPPKVISTTTTTTKKTILTSIRIPTSTQNKKNSAKDGGKKKTKKNDDDKDENGGDNEYEYYDDEEDEGSADSAEPDDASSGVVTTAVLCVLMLALPW